MGGVEFRATVGGPGVTVTTHGEEVSRGEVGGTKGVSAPGRLITAGAVVKNIVWPNGAFVAPSRSGEIVSFRSSSAQDGPGGTGIHEMEVHYVKASDFTEAAITVSLNGTTPVTGLLPDCAFIQCMHIYSDASGNTSVGSALSAVGLIEAYKAGTEAAAVVYSLIAAGGERCTSSLRMVPAGKRLMIKGATGSAVSGTSASRVVVELVATELEGHQYLNPYVFMPHPSIGIQDGSEAFQFAVPPPFSAGTIVGFRATCDKGADISATWYGFFETAN